MPALFYHLTRSTVEDTLAGILTRALAQGWRVGVRGPDRAQLDRLDLALWRREGFLPHGLAGGPQDRRQPVLLAEGGAFANDPQALVSVGGAEVTAAEVAGHERVWIFFDGNDPDAVAHARGQWRALTGAGAAAQYWSEDEGRWAKKAEAGG